MRPDDTIARFGGDEFVILLERVDEPRPTCAAIADRVADEIKRAVRARRPPALPSPRASASRVADGDDDVTAEELLRDADAAMYQAKEQGKAQLEFFDESLRTRAVERLELEAGLRDALAAGPARARLPARGPARGPARMFGIEALLRWQHPEHGHDLPRALRPDRRAERPDRRRSASGCSARPAARPPSGAPTATRTS